MLRNGEARIKTSTMRSTLSLDEGRPINRSLSPRPEGALEGTYGGAYHEARCHAEKKLGSCQHK